MSMIAAQAISWLKRGATSSLLTNRNPQFHRRILNKISLLTSF